MYDDAYEVPGGGGGGAEDDDDYVLQHDDDKPGIVRWAEALPSRYLAPPSKCCIGYWDEASKSVALTLCRGKKFAVMGFSTQELRHLYAEEALFLLDDGQLLLLREPPSDAETASSRAENAALKAARKAAKEAGVEVKPYSWKDRSADERGASRDDDCYLPFPTAFSALLQHVHLRDYQVYVYLRGMGLVVLRHLPLREYGSVGGSSGRAAGVVAPSDGRGNLTSQGPALLHPGGRDLTMFARASVPLDEAAPSAAGHAAPPPARADPNVWLVTQEPELQPLYDVYARDGLTTFKLSAPGPPDFYVLVQSADEPPPSPTQISRLSVRLSWHMLELRAHQRARGVVPLPTLNEVGGGGSSGTAFGGAGTFMSRTEAPSEGGGGGAAAASVLSLPGPAPNVKLAIVAHTTITFFAATTVQLRLPAKYRPQHAPAPVSLVLSGTVVAAAATCADSAAALAVAPPDTAAVPTAPEVTAKEQQQQQQSAPGEAMAVDGVPQ